MHHSTSFQKIMYNLDEWFEIIIILKVKLFLKTLNKPVNWSKVEMIKHDSCLYRLINRKKIPLILMI